MNSLFQNFGMDKYGILKLLTARLGDLWRCVCIYVLTSWAAFSYIEGLPLSVQFSALPWGKFLTYLRIAFRAAAFSPFFVKIPFSVVVKLRRMYQLTHSTFSWPANAGIFIFAFVLLNLCSNHRAYEIHEKRATGMSRYSTKKRKKFMTAKQNINVIYILY